MPSKVFIPVLSVSEVSEVRPKDSTRSKDKLLDSFNQFRQNGGTTWKNQTALSQQDSFLMRGGQNRQNLTGHLPSMATSTSHFSRGTCRVCEQVSKLLLDCGLLYNTVWTQWKKKPLLNPCLYYFFSSAWRGVDLLDIQSHDLEAVLDVHHGWWMTKRKQHWDGIPHSSHIHLYCLYFI